MIINAATLKEVLDKIHDDYEIYYCDDPIQDKVEVDVSGKRIILKS